MKFDCSNRMYPAINFALIKRGFDLLRSQVLFFVVVVGKTQSNRTRVDVTTFK